MVTVWLGPLIDVIGITIPFDNSFYGHVLNQFYLIKLDQKTFVPYGEVRVWKGGPYITHMSYVVDKSRGRMALVTIGTSKSHYKYLKLTLYPQKYKEEDFEIFCEVILGELLLAPYQIFFETGHVSYLEIAADTISHSVEEIIPFRPHTQTSFVYDDDGLKGTRYIGSMASNLRYAIYDKNKCLLDKGQKTEYKSRTRIEARLKKTKLTPLKLTELKNPFKKIEIADASVAHLASNSDDWKKFIYDCEEYGASVALSLLPKIVRKDFETILRGCSAPWWNADFIWSGFPQALERIVPHYES
jgi:hypothetical protein